MSYTCKYKQINFNIRLLLGDFANQNCRNFLLKRHTSNNKNRLFYYYNYLIIRAQNCMHLHIIRNMFIYLRKVTT